MRFYKQRSSINTQNCENEQNQRSLPKSRQQATEEEEAIALDKGWKEGKESIDRHAYQEWLSPSHLVCQASPEERPHHHPKVHYATCNTQKYKKERFCELHN